LERRAGVSAAAVNLADDNAVGAGHGRRRKKKENQAAENDQGRDEERRVFCVHCGIKYQLWMPPRQMKISCILLRSQLVKRSFAAGDDRNQFTLELMTRARSSGGQSICLLSRGSQVRVLPGSPFPFIDTQYARTEGFAKAQK